jgi:GNAT superfamily N-acetyltransferase
MPQKPWLDSPGSGWLSAMVEIVEIDPHDAAALREFWDVEQAAQRADRSDPVLRSLAQLTQQVSDPSPYFRHVLLGARLGASPGDRLLGVADLGLTQQDNLHLAEVEVNVLPAARRQGVGRALHDDVVRRASADGRTTYLGEANVPAGAAASPATSFATALGFGEAHREDHQVLDLPIEARWATPRDVPGYDVLTWTDRAPGDVVDAYARMRTQMGRDVPTGEIDHAPTLITVEKIRLEEERTASAYQHLVAVARRRSDGVLGGYSLVFLPRGDDYVVQDDTLVMPEHRGHGLGLALKTNVLAILRRDHDDRRSVHTWNAVDNPPMQRINRELGFRPVEVLLEMQRRDADA